MTQNCYDIALFVISFLLAAFVPQDRNWQRAYAIYFNPFGVQADGIFIPASLTAMMPARKMSSRDDGVDLMTLCPGIIPLM